MKESKVDSVNLGGGFPARYRKRIPGMETYGEAIVKAVTRHFGNEIPQLIVEPGRGVDHREITDGTPNTLLVVEAPTAVEWTRPEDLGLVPGRPALKFGAWHREGANVLMADRSTRWLRPELGPEIRRALVTINGGEASS
jgi:hypothetical protein